MEHTRKDGFSRNTGRKILAWALIFSIFSPWTQALFTTHALVVDGSVANTLSGANGNSVNLANSGSYLVNYSFSGTLDPGNTFLLTAIDGSGRTATGAHTSASGGESSGSLSLSFASGAWREGAMSFSGVVYSGAIASQVVASGMVLTGILDITPPGATLSLSGTNGSGATSVNIITTEAASGLTLSDISTTNATLSGFVQTNPSQYSFILTPSTSTGISTVSVGTGMFSDIAGNPNNASNILSLGSSGVTTPPSVTIISHASGATVSGFPTLSGSVSSSGSSVTSVSVNGFLASLGSGTWSKTIYDLAQGANIVKVVATDLTGNSGSASIVLNRVSFPYNTNVELSGTTSAVITFSTDLSSTGIVAYGTGLGLLNSSVTGSTVGTSHRFTLSGLLPDTIYYFTVQGLFGTVSVAMHFKTPSLINVGTASGSLSATSAVYLSGATATGAVFSGSGSLQISSLTSSGSSITLPFSGLVIASSSSGAWDGVIQAPEVTSDPANLSLSGYAFTGTFYQIGNANTELFFSGQAASVTVRLGTSLNGQSVRIFRSGDRGVTYAEVLPTCTVTAGNCTFTTNQLSRFAFAVIADVTPGSFSFSGITGAEISTLYVSAPVTMTGISGQTPITAAGGEYSINNGPFTASTGTINTGDNVVLRVMSSSAYSTAESATLTVGGISGSFSVTTKAAPVTGGGGSSGGGGGGGGGGTLPDYCPSGDTSPSYYDRICSGIFTATATQTGQTVIPNTPNIVSIASGTFTIPPVSIQNLGDLNFLDINESWASFYIIRLAVRGIVNNSVLYRPDNNLTRAEFLKILINTTGWKTVSGEELDLPFNDVSSGDWYAPYTSIALSHGMITRANSAFRPNDPITRAEATKMVVTALGVGVIEPTAVSFSDLDMSSDLTKYIEAAKFLGILSGQLVDGQLIFRPNDPITRAEIAKVVVGAFHL